MTTITYSTSADMQFKGCNWTAYMRKKPSLTRIFYEIWDRIKELENVPFDELLEAVKEHNYGSRATNRIGKHQDKIIEIFQYGILPIIWVEKL